MHERRLLMGYTVSWLEHVRMRMLCDTRDLGVSMNV